MRETRHISQLNEWDKNPRSINESDFNRLKGQIESLGQYKPFLITSDGTVIGGNMRLKACRALGITDVWVSVVEFAKDDEDNYYAVIDGKYTKKQFKSPEDIMMGYALSDNDRAGYYDADLLANMIDQFNVDWDQYGVDMKPPVILGDLVKEFGMTIEDTPPKAEEGDADSKLGEVYQLGRHRLICGDSTDPEVYDKLFKHAKNATMTFTSPPYNMGSKMYREYKDDRDSEDYIMFNLTVANNCLRYTQGFLFWNISYNKNSRWEFLEILNRLRKDLGLTFLESIVWDKGHGMPITSNNALTRQYEYVAAYAQEENKDLELFAIHTNQKKYYFNKRTQKALTNYWRIGTNDTQLENHAACYPVGLPAKAMTLMTDVEDVILDPFGGSGTTIIAAEQLGRTGYMIEYDPIYCDVIRKRYYNYIGRSDEWKNGPRFT